jgi:hypothetical protein
MRVRAVLRERKRLLSDTGWRIADLPPQHAPFFHRSRRLQSGWRWRSLRAVSDSGPFVIVVVCRPGRAKWQAILAQGLERGYAIVARFEDHGSHAGVHVHADCEDRTQRLGALGMDDLVRNPRAGSFHRRRRTWTEESFVAAALRFFRVEKAAAGAGED